MPALVGFPFIRTLCSSRSYNSRYPDFALCYTDRRESLCFTGYEHGTGRPQCIFDVSSSVTKATCCCSIGTAWGNRCEECPQIGTKEYEQLCPSGPGYRPNRVTVILEDINECEEHENICQNGHCTNTFGSFMCSCNEGFILDDSKTSCIGNGNMRHLKNSIL